jgi:hypothetical protein
MDARLVLLGPLLLSVWACAGLAPSSVLQPEDPPTEAGENLSAIRALPTSRPAGRPVEPSAEGSDEHAVPPHSSPAVPVETYRSDSRARLQRAPGDVTVRIPWTPSRSAREYQPSPQVPPYTVHPPVTSAPAGPIRCVPDYLGGQRCRAE